MHNRIFLLTAVLMAAIYSQARERQNFDAGWRFILADSAQMAGSSYQDGHWRMLNLPHDWAIEGDFLASNPSGAGGGALPGGIGWYRKTFTLSGDDALQSRYFIEFDGVYMNSTVYVNGQKVGHRPYGYSSFEYEITQFLKKGSNVIAVRVDNSDQPNSRWYSGCGIYRHVWFTKTGKVRVAHWGTHVKTLPVTVADRKWWTVAAYVTLDGVTNEKVQVVNTLYDATGKKIGSAKGLSSTIRVPEPQLWSPADPHTYKLLTEVVVNGKTVDAYETLTAFRDFRFDAQTGFWLNGKNMKLNGVCEHHDFGCLGAVVNEDAMHRKLTKLKAMGVNAIRSSHNPPAPSC